jgi:cytoskeleton protein RodZ
MALASKLTPHEFGEALRAARSGAGVALEMIAERTKIPMRTLSALETGEFAKLPNRVFARMFLRQILESLGRSPDEWLPAFDAAWQRFEDSRQLVPLQPSPPIRRRRVGPWFVGLGLVAVGVAAALLIAEKPARRRHLPPPPIPLPVAAVPAPEPAAEPTAAAPEPTATPVSAPGLLVVRTGAGPCWVEVRVAGEAPVSRLLAAGTTWEVEGGGREVELVVGDAGAVSVEYMGETRSPAGAPGAVARFRMAGAAKPGGAP